MQGKRNRNCTRVLIAVAFSLLLVTLGFLAGFFTAKAAGTELFRHPDHGSNRHSAAPGTGPAQDQQGLQQLPAPWTEEASRLASQQDTDASTRDLYTWFDDASTITEELTAAFLQRLQQELEARKGGSSAATLTNNSTASAANLTAILPTFVGVARDVLSYLRAHDSQVLLPLLRQFATRRTIIMSDVHPDMLRGEVHRLLNLTALGEWYQRVAQYDHPELRSRPPAAWGQAKAEPPSTNSSSGGDGDTRRHRMLLSVAQGSNTSSTGPSRLAISGQPAADNHVMTLKGMLCAVQQFSPSGLQGMLLPPIGNATGKAAQGRPITCPLLPKVPAYKKGKVAFKPVKIPVVFHCQRFRQGDTLQPPLWRVEEAARNLVAVTNKLYSNTSIQFTLKEVRHDPEKHPYLLFDSLQDWQACTGNPGQEAAGFPCLQDTARVPEVAALAHKYIINVFVGGSQASMFCNATTAVAADGGADGSNNICKTLYYGYAGSFGPWFAHSSPSWGESVSDENWVFITWDMFSPFVKNGRRFWDGGAVTLAHELGHYLGLMHTHEGSTDCEGDGDGKSDSVPDTSANQQLIQWALKNGLAVDLARWCSEFRNGRKPQPKLLRSFDSCKGRAALNDGSHVDNVFNLMSYVPDECNMLFTPNQVERLQWAIATFRPKMLVAYAV